jgi:surface antigen
MLCLCSAVAVTLVAGSPAIAKPPPWAPAHGYRAKHEHKHHRCDHDCDHDHGGYRGHRGERWPDDYGVLGGRCNRAAIGTVLGGVVGGAVGSQIGKGSDRVVAIIAGAAIGAIIGHEIGEGMDDRDRACTGHALELVREGRSVHWLNDATGVSYVVTPIGSMDGDCRRFKLQASRHGKSRVSEGRACRSGNGIWNMARAY